MGDFKSAIMQCALQKAARTPGTFRKLPDLRPSSVNFFEPLRRGWAHKDKDLIHHYKVLNMDHLLAPPHWSWCWVYQTPEVLEHGVQGAIDRSVSAGGDLGGIDPTLVPHLPNTITLQTLDNPQEDHS